MNILVLGCGGREHALCHTFNRQGHKVWCIPGNGGTELITEKIPAKWSHVDPNHFDSLIQFVKETGIDLTVVGPEAYLAKGIVNAFQQAGCPIFGPTSSAARLESSKSFSKEFMKKYGIPTAKFTVCTSVSSARRAAREILDECGGVVIKPSGLTAGKGVVCCDSVEEAEHAIESIIEHQRFGQAGSEVVVEELLKGKEVSLLTFCDGEVMVPLPTSQDHKRLYNQEKGPNTGGVGAYSPAPFVTSELDKIISEEIIQKTNKGLKKEGILYQGILYFGLMMTDSGPKLLEFNCRFGDPEAQAILPLLESDLAEIMLSCINGTLKDQEVEWKKKSSCCVVMCSGGYPGGYHTGYAIEGIELVNDDNLICFHAGTKKQKQGFSTAGGRVLCVTGLGSTLEDAVTKAYDGVEQIQFKDAHYRTDIAHQALQKQT